MWDQYYRLFWRIWFECGILCSVHHMLEAAEGAEASEASQKASLEATQVRAGLAPLLEGQEVVQGCMCSTMHT